MVIQTRIPVQATTSGTLYFQHSAVREDEGFVDIDPTNINVDLTSSGQNNVVIVIENPLRFVRWRVDNAQSDAKFLTDVIGR